jgi:hypothetical protein
MAVSHTSVSLSPSDPQNSLLINRYDSKIWQISFTKLSNKTVLQTSCEFCYVLYTQGHTHRQNSGQETTSIERANELFHPQRPVLIVRKHSPDPLIEEQAGWRKWSLMVGMINTGCSSNERIWVSHIHPSLPDVIICALNVCSIICPLLIQCPLPDHG